MLYLGPASVIDGRFRILEAVGRGDTDMRVRPQAPSAGVRVLSEIGEATVTAGKTLYGLLGFFGAVCIAFWNVLTNPRRFRVRSAASSDDSSALAARSVCFHKIT